MTKHDKLPKNGSVSIAMLATILGYIVYTLTNSVI